MTTVITAKLSLAMRLIDTTTGKELTETNVRIYKDGNMLRPIKKGEAVYVFVNEGKEDSLMQIKAYGYDDQDVKVTYETLDPRLPMIDVFLMPSEKNRVGGSVLEIHGTLSGLEFIEAINLNRPVGLFHSVQEKREVVRMNLLPLTAGGGVKLDNITYALLSETKERYDCFNFIEQDAPLSVVLDGPIKAEHKLNDGIFRIIYGRAGPDGRFSLKVRDDSSSLPHLIHFKVGEDEYFKLLDFHNAKKKINLLDGAVLDKPTAIEEEVKEEVKDE